MGGLLEPVIAAASAVCQCNFEIEKSSPGSSTFKVGFAPGQIAQA